MKKAIIFGASGGIGSAIAKKFATCGYYVYIHYNSSKEEADAILKNIKDNGGDGCTCKADITSLSEVTSIINSIDKLDVAILSSGIAKNSLLIDMEEKDIQNIVNVNLLGTIYSAKAVASKMLENHYGKIITISSMWGEVGACMESVYSASKGGIISFTKALAKELGYNGINVNCIAPGLIDTKMNKNLSSEDIQDLIDNTPSSRIGTPKDIADAAYFLASDEASFINGQVLSVNGGFVI